MAAPNHPINPDEEVVITQETTEIHRISGLIAPYDPPELDFTEAELDRFIEKMVFGEPWSESFTRDKVQITLRTRSRRESEFVTSVIEYEARQRLIMTQAELTNRINSFNIILSAVEYRGAGMPVWSMPARPWTDDNYKAFSAFVESHPLSDMPDPLHFVLMAIMVQFQDKCYRMQKRIVEDSTGPDFSRPGVGS